MTAKIIAENILCEDDFLSATEQAGPYVGQPQPDGNGGDFRLLSKGAPADFSYNGTATSNGSTTTIICSALSIFGNDYFIGAIIEFTGGANSSGTKVITDFDQSTGTLAWSGALNSTLIGDTFTLTVQFSTRDFRVELVSGGDAGDATFKWSHDGGTTYFGRNDPWQADWLVLSEIFDNSSTRGDVIQAANGDIVAVFDDDTNGQVSARISSDGGITWGDVIEVEPNGAKSCFSLIRLKSGRILAFLYGGYLNYSDDDGVTWVQGPDLGQTIYDAVELANGNILAVREYPSNEITCIISEDGGFTWSDPITVANDANYQENPSVTQAANGDIVCVYKTDEDAVGNDEIKCKISSDGGGTWGSAIDVIDYVASDYNQPHIRRDISGRLYCVATDPSDIYLTYSDNDGASWESSEIRLTAGGGQTQYPKLVMIDGHEIWCAHLDITHRDFDFVRRGMWEVYSANACPCSIQAEPQVLACNVKVVWHGGSGIAGDAWSFACDYRYSMKNLIEHSPSKAWRSEQDNIACNIVLDMGANKRFRATGAAFFGCNIRACNFQMHTSNSWGSPDVDEAVSFQLATGAVDAIDGNMIQDTSLLANHKNHELKSRFLRMTSGSLGGASYKIKDNVGDYIMLDTSDDISLISVADTFEIFQKNIAATFSGGNKRFIRVNISTHHTADGYYQIGSMVAGEVITLNREWGKGWVKEHQYDIEMLETPAWGMIPIKGAGGRRVFQLGWNAAKEVRKEIEALADYLEGKNLVLIPDSAVLTDCYLCKLIGGVSMTHASKDRFKFTINLVEAL